MNKQNIVLVGFRGAGKAAFGRAIAKVKGLPFADLDAEVEFILGESIDDFVEKHGWQVFRDVEQRVVHDFSRNFSGILATGGGTIENSKNLQNLKKTGTLVFINPNFSDVRKYLLTDETQKNRPRIMPDIPLAQEVDQLWQQRKTIYGAIADFEVTPGFNTDKLEEAQKIVEQLPDKVFPKVSPHKKVAILSSSGGTTFQGLLDAQAKGRIPNGAFTLFITDNPDCEALKKARKAQIPHIHVLEPQDGDSREEYDRQIINILREHQPDVILLAGWMRILSELYCEQFGQSTLNVHPSLLPKYAGMKDTEVHKAVIEHEDKYTGCTLHRVTTELDGGEMFLQRKVPVDPVDTVDVLKQKVQRQEVLGFCEAIEHRRK